MYKLVLAGDAAVGKSSFILRLCKNKFHSNLNATLGKNLYKKLIIVIIVIVTNSIASSGTSTGTYNAAFLRISYHNNVTSILSLTYKFHLNFIIISYYRLFFARCGFSS